MLPCSCPFVVARLQSFFRRYPNCFLVGKNQHDFLDLLDSYIEGILSSGVVENTICKYTDEKGMGISLLPGRKRKDG